jgi:hypothetical protein
VEGPAASKSVFAVHDDLPGPAAPKKLRHRSSVVLPAGRTDYGDDLALREGETDIVEHFGGTEHFAEFCTSKIFCMPLHLNVVEFLLER